MDDPSSPSIDLSPDLVERLGRVKVADLADGCRRLGFRAAAASPALRSAAPYSSLIGIAQTVRCSIEAGDRTYGQQAADLYERGQPARRAVVAQENDVPDFTSIGSGGARIARAQGYVGWITSGPIRDTDELRDASFPVYGTSVAPSGRLVSDVPKGTAIHFEFDVPVEIAGMPVHPGDVLIGDNDGVIALPPDRLVAILEEAEAILREEAAIFDQIDRGLTYREILDAADLRGSAVAAEEER
jgi:regulator of RNase E activity RraA